MVMQKHDKKQLNYNDGDKNMLFWAFSWSTNSKLRGVFDLRNIQNILPIESSIIQFSHGHRVWQIAQMNNSTVEAAYQRN